MNYPINWKRIADAVSFYQEQGYVYVEAPWIVPEACVRATLPDWAKLHLLVGDGALVGSAEQAFIHMVEEGRLTPGKYMAAGPCFRYEKEHDYLHQQYFFKVELIHLLEPQKYPDGSWKPLSLMQEHPGQALSYCLGAAVKFFNTQTSTPAALVDTKIGFDLELHGIEIGSYGIRNHGPHTWVYGTGVAEPRFSQALASRL